MKPLPDFLKRTPEQVKAEKHRQELARDLHLKGARQTPAEQRVGHAVLAEQAVRENLKQIDGRKHPKVYKETMLLLAETLADQGRYAEAAEIDPQWEPMIDAVEKDDDATCDCVPDTTPVQSRNARGETVTREVPIPNEFVVGEAFSKKHNKIIPLVKCAKCGHLNAKPSHNDTHELGLLETNRAPIETFVKQ